MRRLRILIALYVFACASSCFSATDVNETPIESQITSIGVFKNGLLVVQEAITFPGPGRYVLKTPLLPVHGSFFLDGDSSIVVTSKLCPVALPLDQVDDFDWTRDFAGQQVRIALDEGEPFDAEICIQGTSDQSQPNRLYSSSHHLYSSSHIVPGLGTPAAEKQIVLKKADGGIVVVPKKSCVTSVELKSGSVKVVRSRPVILFDVPRGQAKESAPAKISMFYLTNGMTWAPAWNINSDEDKKVCVAQTALLVNQWRSFKDVPVFLISGYPQVSMKSVLSPLAPSVSLDYFFESLSVSEQGRGSDSFAAATQQVMSNIASPAIARSEGNLPLALTGEGPDLVFQPVGKVSLEKNERLYLRPATKETSCNCFICWNIPDDRDEWGRNDNSRRDRNQYGRTTSGEMEQTGFDRFTEPWDVWEFANPFDFPMTTAPANVSRKNRFVGQTLSFWTSPGQKNSLAVNKALGILALSREEEVAPRQVSVKEKELPTGSDRQADSAVSHSVNAGVHKPSVGSQPRATHEVPAQTIGTGTGESLLDTVRQNVGVAVLGNRLDSLSALPPGVDFKRVTTNSDGQATVVVNGRSYRIATVKATIELTNNRKEEVQLIVRRRFSGERLQNGTDQILSTKSPPGKTMVLAGLQTGINRRHEISWDFVMAPGEKKMVEFFYQVLISL